MRIRLGTNLLKGKVTKVLAGACGLLLVLSLIVALAVPALAIPQAPHQFWGNVTINGQPVPEGWDVQVTAEIDTTEYKSATVDTQSRYGYVPNFLVPANDPETPAKEGGVSGETINFFVEGFPAGSFIFAIGGTTPLNLNANIALPGVTTAAATDITNNSATLNGSLDDLGDYTTVDVSFEWGTTSGALDQETTPPQAMGATGSFSAGIDGLLPDTTYYFKAKATGSVTVYGDELSFTTLALEIEPLLYIDLAIGWNTFSTPINLDPDYDEWGELVTLAGLNIEIAWYFDGATQLWGQVLGDYVMSACDAIYVNMVSAGTVPIYPDPGPSVSAKDVDAGWNLVGLASLEDMAVDEALISLYYAEGELLPWGYSQVISPALNQPGWTYPRDGTVVPNMLMGNGYWGAMENDDEYLGQTTTPWEP